MSMHVKLLLRQYVPVLIAVCVAVSLMSCSKTKDNGKDEDDAEIEIVSDEVTESKIEGTWISSETEYEDGVSMKFVQETTYMLPSHEVVVAFTGYVNGDRFLKGRINGKWAADKEWIHEKYDIARCEIEVDPYYADEVSADELKMELMKEKKDFKERIVSLDENSMTLLEDGEETNYTRK